MISWTHIYMARVSWEHIFQVLSGSKEILFFLFFCYCSIFFQLFDWAFLSLICIVGFWLLNLEEKKVNNLTKTSNIYLVWERTRETQQQKKGKKNVFKKFFIFCFHERLTIKWKCLISRKNNKLRANFCCVQDLIYNIVCML